MKQFLDKWSFKTNTEECTVSVMIPHVWSGYKGEGEYTTTFFHGGERTIIRFLAADRYARVYVNGSFIGEHKGGYSAFAFDVSKACREGENELKVILDNRSQGEISPLAGDFTVFGGLYRPVELHTLPSLCFDRTYYGTEGVLVKPYVREGNGVLEVTSCTLGTVTADTAVSYEVTAPDGTVTRREASPGEKIVITIEHPVLWNGKADPALYQVKATLREGGERRDEVILETGFRSLNVDGEAGFFLNGRHLRLNGVSRHQDRSGVFTAATESDYEEDIAIINEIGANAVRLSHYQHAAAFYSLCDRAGLLVWAEIPLLRLTEDEKVYENAASQLAELILQNLHHVSICFWGIQNEIAMFGESEEMYQKLRKLNALVKQLDETRLSGSANLYSVKNDSPMNRITDVTGYNIYFGWYYGEMEDNRTFLSSFHQDNPDIPLLITEYGVDANPSFHSDNPAVKDYSEEFQAKYHETVYPIFLEQKTLIGSFIWNLFDFSSEIRDEGGVKGLNAKGLVSYDRTLKKDAFYYYKAQWSEEPFIHIASKRFLNRSSETIDVKVYSNLKEVTLEGRSYSKTGKSDNGVFLFPSVPLDMGENRIRAKNGNITDEAVFNRHKEADASYVFIDTTPGIKVKNWFTDQLEEERLFPKGKYSIRDNVSVIKASKEAFSVLEELLPSLASELRSRGGDMPLEKVLFYKKKEITDEECRTLNSRLIKVSK